MTAIPRSNHARRYLSFRLMVQRDGLASRGGMVLSRLGRQRAYRSYGRSGRVSEYP
jgi:hypothetical protein